MKKTVLTLITICAFAITNAQKKANHNITRSNQSRGIIVKEEIKDKFDKSKIRKLKAWEVITKDYVLLGDDNHYYTYEGDRNTVKKFLETQNQSQDQTKRLGCPCFKFIILDTGERPSLHYIDEPNVDIYIPITDVTNDTYAVANPNGQIVINSNNRVYHLKADKKIIDKLIKLRNKQSELKSNNDCQSGCFCFNSSVLCVDIKEDFPNYVKETGNSVDEDCDGITNSKLFVKMTKRGTPELYLHCCTSVKRGWEDATAKAVKEASKKAHTQKHIFVKNNIKYYYNGDLDKLNKCNAKLKEAGWIAIENGSIPNATKRKRNKNFNRKGERVKRTQF